MLAAVGSADWLTAMYGCALVGMSVVPISPFSTPAEIRRVIEHCAGGVVLACSNAAEAVARTCAEMPEPPAVRSIADWPPAADIPLECPVGPGDEFLVQYTSGTTGEPKGVRLSHLAVLNSAGFFADGAEARTGDVWFNPLPLHHVGGFVSGVLSCLAIGGTHVAVERFTAADALRILREFRPALVGMVPTMLIDLLANPGVSERDFTSVRVVIGGATDIDPRLVDELERHLGIRFLVGYGQSESPCMAMTFPSDDAQTRTRSLGHPLPGRDYYIGDEYGNVVSTGTDGELFVRGPLDMLGYVGAEPEAHAHDYHWRPTGDVCSLSDAGVLTFRGRIRDVIIRGGTNIYPGEVEHVLSTHPEVAEVAVIGVPDPRLGQRVVATVRLRPDSDLNADDLSDFASHHLGSQKRPTAWVFVKEFPRTSTGKVRKHLLASELFDK